MNKSLSNSEKTKATCVEQAAFETTSIKPKNNPIPKKWQRVLLAFLGGRSYNRFETERLLNDHCLHSTVSALEKMGVPISRKYETVPGYMSHPTTVCRYWLWPSAENLKAAMDLLPQYKLHGGE